MSLGERIRTLRGEQKLSQFDLAEALGVSRQSVSKWETDGAVPDLDKLVCMSELFGVTLDTLVKGAPSETSGDATVLPAEPVAAARPIPARSSHTMAAGVILLCFGALAALLMLLLGGGWTSLLFAAPFLLCGLICLRARRRVGLWCGWSVFLSVDLYFRNATGITWQIIFSTLRLWPEGYYAHLVTGWAMFLCALLLLFCTLRSYRGMTLSWSTPHLIELLAGWGALAGLTAAHQSVLNGLLPSYNYSTRDIYFSIDFGGDLCKLALFTLLLVLSAALLRGRRRGRSA